MADYDGFNFHEAHGLDPDAMFVNIDARNVASFIPDDMFLSPVGVAPYPRTLIWFDYEKSRQAVADEDVQHYLDVDGMVRYCGCYILQQQTPDGVTGKSMTDLLETYVPPHLMHWSPDIPPIRGGERVGFVQFMAFYAMLKAGTFYDSLIAVRLLDKDGVEIDDWFAYFYTHDTWTSILATVKKAKDELDLTMNPRDIVLYELHAYMSPIVSTLLLMNTKNVEIKDKPLARQMRRRLERKGLSVPKVLTVRVPRTRITGNPSDRGEVNVVITRKSLVAGHFATYTPEKPLFGKPGLHGVFYRPPYVKGSADPLPRKLIIGDS